MIGAPIPAGTIDPELLRLRKKAAGVGVVAAATLTLFSLWMMVRLLPDLRFSRAGDAPSQLSVAQLVAGSEDRYVEAIPDLVASQTVRIRGRTASEVRAVPIAGSRDRAWLILDGSGWIDAPLNGAYAGRLRALDSTPWASALRGFVSGRSWPRFATLAAVRASAGAGQGTIATVDGGEVRIAPTEAVDVEVALSDTATIDAAFNTRFPDAKAWHAALVTAGVIDASARPSSERNNFVSYEVRLADAVAETSKRLLAAGLWAARVSPVNKRVASTVGAVAAGPVVVDGRALPDAEVGLIQFTAPRTIPADARVLIVGERPADYWFLLPLEIALGALAALFVWALVRAVRRDILLPRRAAPTGAG